MFEVSAQPLGLEGYKEVLESGGVPCKTRSISIIIPAFNEEQRLPATLATIQRYLERDPWDFKEILVIDDGSTDGTAAVGRAGGALVLENPGNRGKGYSVRHGMLKARGEWALLSDADLSAPIQELHKLWHAVDHEGAAMAIGSRAMDESLIGVHQPMLREMIGRFFNIAVRTITGLPFHDTQCGFKLFKTAAAQEIFRRQRLDGFGFDVEVLCIARSLGYRTIEIPVRWSDVEGTKVRLTRGLTAFFDPFKVRWNELRGRYR